jgi:hypothetical protein
MPRAGCATVADRMQRATIARQRARDVWPVQDEAHALDGNPAGVTSRTGWLRMPDLAAAACRLIGRA